MKNSVRIANEVLAKQDRNTIEFAVRCPIETLGEDDIGNIRYRFDTRLLGGDYTIISVMREFATECVARAKLFEELQRWNMNA